MKTPAPADLQRWSEELARNPASLAFLPLARAYRRLGRRDLATRLCLRGLEAHPANVEAHALLALLHLEEGDRARAADEWSIVLRLKPGNFEALRGMGFRYLEQNDIPRARQHLERAALIRPDDTTVQEALRLLRQREVATRAAAEPGPQEEREGAAAAGGQEPPPGSDGLPSVDTSASNTGPAEPWAEAVVAGEPQADELPELVLDEPWAASGPSETVSLEEPWAEGEEFAAAPAETEGKERPTVQEGARSAAGGTGLEGPRDRAAEAPEKGIGAAPVDHGDVERGEDPNRLFADLVKSEHIIGALLLDPRGLVLAGSIGVRSSARADDVGAILGAAVDEAARTSAFLELGRWTGMLIESEAAVVHVLPVAQQGIVMLAAAPEAPTGWILRASAQAARRAARFLEVPA